MAEENQLPEVNRRKKETGVIRHVIETLIGKQSRKVAFGIWVFVVANGMRERHADMPWDLWWKCVLLSGALIGLGTILDEMLAKLGDKVVGVVSSKINTITSVVETTKVESDVQPAPAQPQS